MRHLYLDFVDVNVTLGFYWDPDSFDPDAIEISVNIETDNDVRTDIQKTIKHDNQNYFADLLQIAIHVQDNYPNIVKSMNLESILLAMFSQSEEVQVHYASHFSRQSSHYVPMSA